MNTTSGRRWPSVRWTVETLPWRDRLSSSGVWENAFRTCWAVHIAVGWSKTLLESGGRHAQGHTDSAANRERRASILRNFWCPP